MKETRQEPEWASLHSVQLNGRCDILFGRSPQVMMEALNLLLQGRRYATQLQHNVWDFAVEIRSLLAVGLHFNDLRWLIHENLVQHSRELTERDDTVRSFAPAGSAVFTRRACFILTDRGEEFLREIYQQEISLVKNHGAQPIPPPTTHEASSSAPLILPSWDCDLREVRYNGVLVKQFKLPSPNQEAVLMTFHEEGWKRRIDDPLPPHPDCDPKQRLHDTIRSLNRNQKSFLLRFKGDGTGEGVVWEPAAGGPSDE